MAVIVCAGGDDVGMAPDLTHHDTLRKRILSVLSSTENGSMPATVAMDTIYERHCWTKDDHDSFKSSTGTMPKWRKRLQTQRERMAKDGLVLPSPDQVWTLTQQGLAEAQKLTANPDTGKERERREQMWRALLTKGGPANVKPQTVRDLGIYGGQAGVFAPAITRNDYAPKGFAVSLLNTGKHYADELTDTGAIYHYPNTRRAGKDESEIEAIRGTYREGLPIFVITPGSKASNRTVHRGYIEDIDDTQGVLLVTFTNDKISVPPVKENQEPGTFDLHDSATAESYSQRLNRPNQFRFAFQVRKRYGTACAVCSVDIDGLVQAAHLVAKSKNGSDDARNGLPLCANHHLALDRGYWCLDAETNVHPRPEGPALSELGIVHLDLSHLPFRPHLDALQSIWHTWISSQAK